MLLRAFDGRLMMILHRPFDSVRDELYEIQLRGLQLRVRRQRTDLDGGLRTGVCHRAHHVDSWTLSKSRSWARYAD